MSDLISIIYSAVEILGGLAIIVLVVSYVSYKLKTKSDLKPFEKEINKENELKVVIKDEKHKKDIVKGALEKTDSNKSKTTSSSQKKSTHSGEDRRRSSTSSSHKSSSHRSSSHKSDSHSSKSSSSRRSSSQRVKVPKPKKPLPSRDKRIQILNKLHHTQGSDDIIRIKKEKDENKDNPRKTNGNGFSKFYDENEE
jgi:hypothetical protein